jgi:hypothetical protein
MGGLEGGGGERGLGQRSFGDSPGPVMCECWALWASLKDCDASYVRVARQNCKWWGAPAAAGVSLPVL